MQGRARKPRALVTPTKIVDAITDMTLQGDGPVVIEQKLRANRKLKALGIPELRTIKKYVALAKVAGPPPDPWRLDDADPDVAAVIVPILAAVIEATHGRVRTVSRDDVAMLTRIVRAAPGVPGWDAYRLMMRLRNDPAIDAAVQAYLSFRPWRGETERIRYEQAVGPSAIGSPYVNAGGEALVKLPTLTGTATTTKRRTARQRKETNDV